ncbi:unnamed protein product [Acanthoscelides obtectus]|uniref:HTH psq-type domain-containing protein n=1 Tax=Acanthoscelides obtectus TaxID=200917 RepID=A0A9P0LNI6_ACAOB|nr:unnamed protein product [Acanthoscelides obtectus]CAK1630881.1 hypothetical protein AOBTE_LOCUS6613 [Acanthoscelides obtectus]
MGRLWWHCGQKQDKNMPNVYVRKNFNNRGSWTEDNLKHAMAAVKDGLMSVGRASLSFQIPRKTLERRLKHNNDKKGKLGPDSWLVLSVRSDRILENIGDDRVDEPALINEDSDNSSTAIKNLAENNIQPEGTCQNLETEVTPIRKMLADISPVPRLSVEAAKRRSRSVASELTCTSKIGCCREKFKKRKVGKGEEQKETKKRKTDDKPKVSRTKERKINSCFTESDEEPVANRLSKENKKIEKKQPE